MSALELLGKEIGMFKERRETKVTLTGEELEAELRRVLAELAEMGYSLPLDKEGKLDA